MRKFVMDAIAVISSCRIAVVYERRSPAIMANYKTRTGPIKWSLDINTGAVERSEAARARSPAGATVGGAVRGLVRVL